MIYDRLLTQKEDRLDTITVLKPWKKSHQARKVIDFTSSEGDKPRISEYDNIRHWRHQTFQVNSLRDVAKTLFWCAKQEQGACIVRGRVLSGAGERIRRLKRPAEADKYGGPYPATLARQAHRWLCLDVDEARVAGKLSTDKGCLEASLRLRCLLPESLRTARCVINLSNRSRDEIVKGHIWLWLPYAVHEDSLRSWQRQYGVFDPVLFETVQPHYCTPPKITGEPWEGWRVAKRIHCLQGAEITADMMPPQWMSDEGWNLHQKNKRIAAQRKSIERFKGRDGVRPMTQDDLTRRSESFTKLLCQDIMDAGVGERHDTILRKIHKAQCKIRNGEMVETHLADIVATAKSVLPQKRHKEVDRMLKEVNDSGRVEILSYRVVERSPRSVQRCKEDVPVKQEATKEESRDLSYIEDTRQVSDPSKQSHVTGDLFGGQQQESYDLPIGFTFEVEMLRKQYKFGESPPFMEAVRDIVGLYKAARSQYDADRAKEKIKPFILQAGWRIQDIHTLILIDERMQ